MAATDGVLFSVTVVGDTTGTTWSGEFRAKERLSFQDRLVRDRIRRELLGKDAEGASVEAMNIAQIVSECAVRLVQAPAWWYGEPKAIYGGLNMLDENVLFDVYENALKIETDASAALKEAGEKAKKALTEIRQKEDESLRQG